MFNQETAFVPGCEYDVFVSYARDDNDWPTPPDNHANGWVHKFRDTLHSFLNQKTRRSGGRVRFFFDTQAVRQHEDFLPQVAEAVRKSAVMIVLISDAWIGSEACQSEVTLFHQMLHGAANQSGRLIPVHLERTADWPSSLAQILNRVTGYECYEHDAANDVTLRHKIGSDGLTGVMTVLRERIAEALIEMRRGRMLEAQAPVGTMSIDAASAASAAARGAPHDAASTIYLAEAVGVKKLRTELESHFRSARLRVLPDQPYPRGAAEFRAAMHAELENCAVFVQVFGAAASTRTSDLPRGYEGLQLEIARELGKPILQWRDPTVEPDKIDEPDHAAMACEAEYFGTPIEFAQAVREKVERMRGSGPPLVVTPGQYRALIKADPCDERYAAWLVEYLANHDVRCRVAPNGAPTLDRHREQPFDAVMMVYGECPQRWIDERSNELEAVLLDQKDQAPVCGFYLDRPRVPPLWVKGLQKVVHQDEKQLQLLLQAIRARAAGSSRIADGARP